MIYPACFWIEDTIQNRLASTAYLAISHTMFLMLTTSKYKIDHNSKSKNRPKKYHAY